jgi:hypothetical protein
LDAQVSVAGDGAGGCSARQFLWRADGFWRAGSDRQPYRRFEGEDGGGVRLADARQGIAVAVIERADLLGVVVPLFNFEPCTRKTGGRKFFYCEADRISGTGKSPIPKAAAAGRYEELSRCFVVEFRHGSIATIATAADPA